MFRETQNRLAAELSMKKRMEKEAKISAAKEQAEAALMEQRRIAEERDRHNLEKRKQFEKQRELSRSLAR